MNNFSIVILFSITATAITITRNIINPFKKSNKDITPELEVKEVKEVQEIQEVQEVKEVQEVQEVKEVQEIQEVQPIKLMDKKKKYSKKCNSSWDSLVKYLL